METIGDAELVLDARADLGEAPTWDRATRRLMWVDMTRGVVHRFDPKSGRDVEIETGRPIGVAVPTASGAILLAAGHGFSLLDPATGRIEPVADVGPSDPATTMNDGKCDPVGRFWAGTKDVEGCRPIGSLYRLEPGGRVARVLGDVTISNGLAWSPDRTTMYYIDSATHAVDAFAVDTDGEVSGRRRHVAFPRSWGLPDGMTVDAEGSLWVAFWTGSAVRRIDPAGRVVSIVELPVSLVTSCAFGGEELADLYVTSARNGLTDAELREQPHAGGLFRLRPRVGGLAQPPFAG